VELLTVQQHQLRRARPSDRSPSLTAQWVRGYREDPPPPGWWRTWPNGRNGWLRVGGFRSNESRPANVLRCL